MIVDSHVLIIDIFSLLFQFSVTLVHELRLQLQIVQVQVLIRLVSHLALRVVMAHGLVHLSEDLHTFDSISLSLKLRDLKMLLVCLLQSSVHLSFVSNCHRCFRRFCQLVVLEVASCQITSVALSLVLLQRGLFVLLVDSSLGGLFIRDTFVDEVLTLALAVHHLTFVESAQVQAVLVAVAKVLLVLTLFIVGILQGQHVPHPDLRGFHVCGVPLLHCGLEM